MGSLQATKSLHTIQPNPYTTLIRAHILVYTCAIAALLFHRTRSLLNSPTFLSIALFIADLIFAFLSVTAQAFRWRPIRRTTYPENLAYIVPEEELPLLDVFLCTADPYKEPPISVVNTALSVMTVFDYPMEKMSVYVSDDGGSELTLFAFMEAARFACHWLPFCRENKIQERCPEVYFGSMGGDKSKEMKMMYEEMREKIEKAVMRGRVTDDLIDDEYERTTLEKYLTTGFTRLDHPAVIKVLLESNEDVDIRGHPLPNLVYISREKKRGVDHHFKAGALNVLMRVSAAMTNAPVLLTLDCDTTCNDPQAPRRALCHLLDPDEASTRLAFVQFPQRFHGIDKNDIYSNEVRSIFRINPMGLDGLGCTNYVGTGCFFCRRAFHGPPSSVRMNTIGCSERYGKMSSETILRMAHDVVSYDYEHGTKWGLEMGFRYGSLVEDMYTGYRLNCEGWESVFCDPDKPAFLGEMPPSLNGALSMHKRCVIGLLQVVFSKHNPLIYFIRRNLIAGFAFTHFVFIPILGIPIMAYAFLPQLALLNQTTLFPTLSDPWFYLYTYIFLMAYVQDMVMFVSVKDGTLMKWWNDQRMWMIKGVTCYPIALLEFSLQKIGVMASAFLVTNKSIDDAQSTRYRKGVFDFGVCSSFFVLLATVAILNLVMLVVGAVRGLMEGKFGEVFVQVFLCGCVVVNCLPVYEAMVLRKDGGRLPGKVTVMALFLALSLLVVGCFYF
ncbi:Cellulose synthase-like protein G3 [Acorus gramineus]|uniref:Cellulose synthase-like protein G3 n=1 Tax=Acorus gramineus TaxID=55184 RepID=A0AAV8ZZL6_ACOGR|nr:Cellulose synthase-like protein G3 [Acorus gramineus]